MKEKLVQAFGGLVDSTIAAVPKVFVGILLVAGTLLVAKLVERALRYALTKVRFDELVGKAGIDTTLQRLGIRQELTTLFPRLTYFLVLLVLARTAGDALGLVAISGAIGAFFEYLPNILAALLLLILGSTVGQFAGQTVSQSAASSGIEFAPALGKLVSSVILFVCAMMAIAQLKIDTDIVRIVTSFVLGGAALAFGLSFGLGTRDIVRNIAAGFYVRKVLVIGKPLEVAGQQGDVERHHRDARDSTVGRPGNYHRERDISGSRRKTIGSWERVLADGSRRRYSGNRCTGCSGPASFIAPQLASLSPVP